MKMDRGWTREQYTYWTWLFGLIGVGMAFIWLGSDYWFFGLCALVGLVFAFWAWVEAERVD